MGSVCGVENTRMEDRCELCGNKRDREAKHWCCTQCTYSNVYLADVCSMCGTKPTWFRCYDCGRQTMSPLRLPDKDCLHVACCLQHLHNMENAWWTIKEELLEMEKELPRRILLQRESRAKGVALRGDKN